VLGTAFPRAFAVPIYLRPDWWRGATALTDLPWSEVLTSWLQHALVAVGGAVGLGLLVKWPRLTGVIQRMLGRSLYSSAWDAFAVQHIGRWVLVADLLSPSRPVRRAVAVVFAPLLAWLHKPGSHSGRNQEI